MHVISVDNRAAFSYQLRLPSFEGPLDVLLRLIEREQLPITEVSLVTVGDQFLEEAARIGGASPESIAEFTAVGTRLVLLKARSLLPTAYPEQDEEKQDDLVVQLLEYKVVKEAAETFGSIDRQAPTAFGRGDRAVELPARRQSVPLARHEPALLSRALGRRILTSRIGARLVELKPLVSLRVMVERLLTAIPRGSQSFQALCDRTCESAADQRAMFLAVLILMKRGVVDATQNTPFGPINIARTGHRDDAVYADVDEF